MHCRKFCERLPNGPRTYVISSLSKDQAVSAICEAMPHVDKQILAVSLDGWNAVDINGAVVLAKGEELHIVAKPSLHGKWLTRKDIRAFFTAQLNVYGRAVVDVNTDNQRAIDFIERLGFVRLSSDAESAQYELTRCDYVG
jgi:GNAT superfamily N-acetyltransferase